MEQRNRKEKFMEIPENTTKKSHENVNVDEVDFVETNFQKTVIKKTTKQLQFHELSPFTMSRQESPSQEDSAYQTYPHSYATKSHSISNSSSFASSDRFPSEESLRSSAQTFYTTSESPSTSKKPHSTLIRIQLSGDDNNKKVSHEWYNKFTSQAHHNQASYSPLTNRAANTSSKFEFDSHIAHMRGNLHLYFIYLVQYSKHTQESMFSNDLVRNIYNR